MLTKDENFKIIVAHLTDPWFPEMSGLRWFHSSYDGGSQRRPG